MKRSHLFTATLAGLLLAGLTSAQELLDDPAPVDQTDSSDPFRLRPSDEFRATNDDGPEAVDEAPLRERPTTDDFDLAPENKPIADDRGFGLDTENSETTAVIIERRLPDGKIVHEAHTRPRSWLPEPATLDSESSGHRTLSRNAQQKLTRAQSAVAEYTNQLKQAPATERARIAEALKVALQHLFDVRTNIRETQVADLEKRVGALRNQLQQRVEKKEDIVRLRLQTLINEANGLTF